MTKIEFFKAAMKAGCYSKLSWIIRAFSVVNEAPDAYQAKPEPYRIVQTPAGYFFLTEAGTLENISDGKVGQPLFSFKETIIADSSFCPNITKPTETIIGNVLFNLICICHAFGTKFPFVTGRLTSISSIENQIAEKLQDIPPEGTERSTDVYYVDEYIRFVDSLQMLSSLSQLSVWAATRKTMTAAPGMAALKKKLMEEYKGQLDDPIILAKIEDELKRFDNAYLKGDPADGTFMTGKIKNVARKKMFISFGAERGFSNELETDPIMNSLSEGWPTDPAQFTAMMNASRAGSFSRGNETQKGGTLTKVLLRAANNFKITDEDCGTLLGFRRTFDEESITQLVGRYIQKDKKWIAVEDLLAAKDYIDKPAIVRSPMYCKAAGDTICKFCAGKRLSENPSGLSVPLVEVGATVLKASLKAMHANVLEVKELDLTSTFS